MFMFSIILPTKLFHPFNISDKPSGFLIQLPTNRIPQLKTALIKVNRERTLRIKKFLHPRFIPTGGRSGLFQNISSSLFSLKFPHMNPKIHQNPGLNHSSFLLFGVTFITAEPRAFTQDLCSYVHMTLWNGCIFSHMAIWLYFLKIIKPSAGIEAGVAMNLFWSPGVLHGFAWFHMLLLW